MPPRAARPVSVASKPPPAMAPAPGSSAGPSRTAGPSSAISPTASASAPTPGPSGSAGRPIAAPPAAGKDLSSSTGRIFAKPSKEWVLPERAKPGRKAATDEPENRRQSQNRLSQRAHRARRTDYIQTLEERLRKYEADEIHSNVRLQEVARALKQDNERMRDEVNLLRTALNTAQSERTKWSTERQTMTDSIRGLQRQLEAATLNSSRSQADSRSPHDTYDYRQSPVLTPALTPRTAGGVTPRGNNAPTPRTALAPSAMTANSTLACPICPDPDPDCPCQRPIEPTLGPSHIEPTLGSMSSIGISRCSLCDLAPEACMCVHHEEIDIKPDISSSPAPAQDDTDCGLCTADSFCACRAAAAASSSTSFAASFSLNLQIPSSPPAPPPKVMSVPLKKKNSISAAPTATVAAPAVALKLRRRPAAKQSVWALDNVPAGTSRVEAVCTGDPNNCDACRNDSFGREFCENLFGKPHKKCSGCGPNGCGSGASSAAASASGSSQSVSIQNLVNPPTPIQQPLVLACCGAPELCGHAGGCAGEVLVGPSSLDKSLLSHHDHDHDHDSGKSRAANSSVASPTDETMRPEEAWRALKAHPNSKFTPLAILADVVARRSKVMGPRVELSPEPEGRCETTGTTGAKRRLAVETSAVRDALKYLDTHGGDGERDPKRKRV